MPTSQRQKPYAACLTVPSRRHRAWALAKWAWPVEEQESAKCQGILRKTMPSLWFKPSPAERRREWRRYRHECHRALHQGAMIPMFKRDWLT